MEVLKINKNKITISKQILFSNTEQTVSGSISLVDNNIQIENTSNILPNNSDLIIFRRYFNDSIENEITYNIVEIDNGYISVENQDRIPLQIKEIKDFHNGYWKITFNQPHHIFPEDIEECNYLELYTIDNSGNTITFNDLSPSYIGSSGPRVYDQDYNKNTLEVDSLITSTDPTDYLNNTFYIKDKTFVRVRKP